MRPFPTSRFPPPIGRQSASRSDKCSPQIASFSPRSSTAKVRDHRPKTGHFSYLPPHFFVFPPTLLFTMRSHSLTRVRTHSRQAFFVFHLHPFTAHPNLLIHNAFRVKALPSPFPSLGFTGRPVFSPRPCPPSHAFDASPPQTAKGEAKKTKVFTPNARSLNKLHKVGEAVKAKNENLWTRARARGRAFLHVFLAAERTAPHLRKEHRRAAYVERKH